MHTACLILRAEDFAASFSPVAGLACSTAQLSLLLVQAGRMLSIQVVFPLQSVGIVPLSTIFDLPSFCLSPALCLAHVSRSQICV